MDRPVGISRRRKLLRAASLGLLAISLGFLGRWLSGNQGTVVPGAFHRSGQLSGSALWKAIRAKGIRTVLNLRGGNPSDSWYQDERRVTLDEGATLVDFAMASDMYLSRSQARTLVDLLDHCEKPVLVHCQWGAERTGLAAAFVEMLRPGGSLRSAKAQFSPYYLFLPVRDGLIMRRHIDRYEAWLAEQGVAHSPDTFRRWIREGYRPGSPSREEWPYDPYPLVVVHRPSGRAALQIARKPHTPAAPKR